MLEAVLDEGAAECAACPPIRKPRYLKIPKH
jgi:hypothetical protein